MLFSFVKQQIFLTCILGIIFFPCFVGAGVDLPWSTTYDCPDYEYRDSTYMDPVDCDGLSKSLNLECSSGRGEMITLDANNPLGGGKGQRHWMGSGRRVSGGLTIQFNTTQNEFWFRWYQRFETGMTWDPYYWNKLIYLQPGTSQAVYVALNSTSDLNFHSDADGATNRTLAGFGWDYLNDNKFHYFEIHLKMDTNGRDGIVELWLDENLIFERFDFDFGTVSGWNSIIIGSNHQSVGNSECKALDYDDLAIATGPIGPIGGSSATCDPNRLDLCTTQSTCEGISAYWCSDDSKCYASQSASPCDATPQDTILLLEENFEDTNFASRGWYDNTAITLSTTEFAPVGGSTRSAEFHFTSGSITPTSGGAMRRKFSETDELYISFYKKYSSNWVGSSQYGGAHDLYILTNLEPDYSNLAFTHLTTYIEQARGVPFIQLQDGQNVDQAKIDVDLTGVSENRAVAGCNGDSDGYGDGSCFDGGGGSYWNLKQFKAGQIYFSNDPGAYYKNDWHHVEVYLRLNSVLNGKGVADGIIQYSYDGNKIIDLNNVMLRTGQYPGMKFDRFIIAPFMGEGSGEDQTFWLDNLSLAINPGGSTVPLLPPSQFQLFGQ